VTGNYFGQPLSHLTAIAGGGAGEAPSAFPKPFAAIGEFIRLNCDDVEGIFRVSGDQDEIQELKAHIDNDEFDESKLDKKFIHNYTGVFKLWLREMPEPLMTFEKYPLFISAFDKADQDEICNVADALPEPHRGFSKLLFDLLADVQQHEAFTKMNSTNLGIVFAPNILRPRVETMETIVGDARKVIGVISVLIDDAVDHKSAPWTQEHQ